MLDEDKRLTVATALLIEKLTPAQRPGKAHSLMAEKPRRKPVAWKSMAQLQAARRAQGKPMYHAPKKPADAAAVDPKGLTR